MIYNVIILINRELDKYEFIVFNSTKNIDYDRKRSKYTLQKFRNVNECIHSESWETNGEQFGPAAEAMDSFLCITSCQSLK